RVQPHRDHRAYKADRRTRHENAYAALFIYIQEPAVTHRKNADSNDEVENRPQETGLKNPGRDGSDFTWINHGVKRLCSPGKRDEYGQPYCEPHPSASDQASRKKAKE